MYSISQCRLVLYYSIGLPSQYFLAAICDNKVVGFFVSDNVQLKSTNVLFYGDVTEEQCAAMCADNKVR